MTADAVVNLSPEEARAVIAALRDEFVIDAATQWRFERARLDALRKLAAAREKHAEKDATAAASAHSRALGGPALARDRAYARAMFAEERLKRASAATQRAFDALMTHYDAEREIA